MIVERPAMPQNVEAYVNTSMNPARIRVSWKSGKYITHFLTYTIF